jgi:leucyl aminopeptidase (aminopeptidase T)
VQGSLGIVAGERLLVVTDAAREPLTKAISDAVRAEGGTCTVLVLEQLAPRPHARLHAGIVDEVQTAQATIALFGFERDEHEMRTRLIEEARKAGTRHAHMIGVTHRSMVAGLAIDSRRIAEQARALLVRFGPDSRIVVRSRAGTDLTVKLAPRCRWVEYSGVVRPGRRDNLPSGEVVTSPAEVDGVYVADATLGDADGQLATSLRTTPITLHIAGARVKAVECAEPAISRRVQDRMARVVDLDRVGLISFGTNTGMLEPTGEIFPDQKLPSFHISLGVTFPELTGATRTCTSWIAFTATNSDVDVDGTVVMRGGRYLI